MDVLSSAEFRKTYARLTKPTKVTVNGHVLGIWTPGGSLSHDDLPEILDRAVRGDAEHVALNASGSGADRTWEYERYDERPIRPVPKHSGR